MVGNFLCKLHDFIGIFFLALFKYFLIHRVVNAATDKANNTDNYTKYYPCDTVLMAAGLRPRKDEVEALRRTIPETEVYIIGDCIRPRMIGDAIREGFGAALAI